MPLFEVWVTSEDMWKTVVEASSEEEAESLLSRTHERDFLEFRDSNGYHVSHVMQTWDEDPVVIMDEHGVYLNGYSENLEDARLED